MGSNVPVRNESMNGMNGLTGPPDPSFRFICIMVFTGVLNHARYFINPFCH